MTERTDRVEIVLPLGDDLTIVHQMVAGPDMNRVVVRGDRQQAEKLVMHLLAQLTGSENLFDAMKFWEVECTLRTMGQLGSYGLDEDLEGELTSVQRDVIANLGRVWEAERDAEMGGE